MVFEALWGGDETRIVVTTDLSHYHDQTTANTLDRETATAIVERYDVPGPDRACGEAADAEPAPGGPYDERSRCACSICAHRPTRGAVRSASSATAPLP